jgi:hypothetical protein
MKIHSKTKPRASHARHASASAGHRPRKASPNRPGDAAKKSAVEIAQEGTNVSRLEATDPDWKLQEHDPPETPPA